MVLINRKGLVKLLSTYEKKKRLLVFTKKRLNEIRGFDVEQEVAFQQRIEELEKMLSFVDEVLEGTGILSNREQSLIYYLFVEKMSVSEIASLFGISKNTTLSIQSAAYFKLMQSWERWN